MAIAQNVWGGKMEKMSEYTSICGKDGNDAMVITKNDLYNIFVWYKYCEFDSIADCVDEVFKQSKFKEPSMMNEATITAGEGVSITQQNEIDLRPIIEAIKADITVHADKEINRLISESEKLQEYLEEETEKLTALMGKVKR